MAETREAELRHLLSFLSTEECLNPSPSLYASETSTWAAQRNLEPSLIVRPSSAQSLAKVLSCLLTAGFDVAVRGSGFGSASAKDVLVSMAAFDDFDFDKETEVLTIGAGQLWRDYYEKMEAVAPDYHVIAARTPALSIGGSILSGGFSWLARQYGNTSDPSNFLDAECVLPSGRILWASEEPDLIWALRGGGGSFCAVTKFKLRAYPYSQQLWAGPIILPRRCLQRVAEGVANMQIRAEKDEIPPQISMDLYVIAKEQAVQMGATEDILIVQAYDALGEEHGRSAEGFQWALQIPGAVDMTKVTNLRGVSEMHEQVGFLKGRFKTYWQGLTLTTVSESTVLNTLKWFDLVASQGGSIASSLLIAFECLCTRDSPAGAEASAWPRPRGMKNTLLCAVGCDAELGSDEELSRARELVLQMPGIVAPEEKSVRLPPNAVEEHHDLEAVFADHLPRLLELKKRYDPGNILKGTIYPTPRMG